MKHLSEAAKDYINMSDEDRIQACRRKILMSTPQLLKTYDIVSDLLATERSDSNMGLTIIGPPGAGKTTIGKKIAETFAQSTYGTVLYIDLANYAEDMDLRAILHRELGVAKTPRNPYAVYDNVKEALRLIREKRIRGIVFDESQDLRRAISARRGAANLTALRSFSNGDYGLTIILIGIPELDDALEPDTQLTSRYNICRVTMEEWKADSEVLANFLNGFVSHLPLKKESIVDSEAFMKAVVKLRGNTRALTHLLRACAIEAIRNGDERITLKLFEAVHFEMNGKVEDEVAIDIDIVVEEYSTETDVSAVKKPSLTARKKAQSNTSKPA
jgi:type II secretory pathway predicted ATPase ExeA